MAALFYKMLLRLSFLIEHFTGNKALQRNKLYAKLNQQAQTPSKNLNGMQVFRGMAADWKSKDWSLHFFKKKYGNENCNLLTDYGLADFRRRNQYEVSTFAQVIGKIRQKKKVYLRFSPLIEQKKELLAALHTNWLRSFRRWDSMSEAFHLFMGSKGTYTRLHAEMEVSLFVQIEGRKRWRLFPPASYTKLYPQFAGRTHFVTEFESWPDASQYPLMQQAGMIEVTLEPGDVLYLPPFWWHFAENLDATVGVSYRFNSLSLALRVSPFLTMMRLLSHNPNIFYTFYHAIVTKRNPLFEAGR